MGQRMVPCCKAFLSFSNVPQLSIKLIVNWINLQQPRKIQLVFHSLAVHVRKAPQLGAISMLYGNIVLDQSFRLWMKCLLLSGKSLKLLFL